MTYIIDSNIFIEAQNTYYCFDVCPGFWDFLSQRFASGELISIRNVYDEIAHKDDDIFNWLTGLKNENIFLVVSMTKTPRGTLLK